MQWLLTEDASAYVMRVLAKEASDIPAAAIARHGWYVDDVPLEDLRVAEDLIDRHDREAAHVERRDRFEARITAGEAIPPLITLGADLFLVDGYARYRALRRLGVTRAHVVGWQNRCGLRGTFVHVMQSTKYGPCMDQAEMPFARARR